MIEVCSNGHLRTEENTRWHKDTTRNRVRRRCADCKADHMRANRPNGPSASEMRYNATTWLHEDLEDLLKFGATWGEILSRGGYCDWNTMYKSLKRRERFDLIEQLRAKKKAAR